MDLFDFNTYYYLQHPIIFCQSQIWFLETCSSVLWFQIFLPYQLRCYLLLKNVSIFCHCLIHRFHLIRYLRWSLQSHHYWYFNEISKFRQYLEIFGKSFSSLVYKNHYAWYLLYLIPPPPPLVIDPNDECPPLKAVQWLEYLLPPEPPVVLILLKYVNQVCIVFMHLQASSKREHIKYGEW